MCSGVCCHFAWFLRVRSKLWKTVVKPTMVEIFPTFFHIDHGVLALCCWSGFRNIVDTQLEVLWGGPAGHDEDPSFLGELLSRLLSLQLVCSHTHVPPTVSRPKQYSSWLNANPHQEQPARLLPALINVNHHTLQCLQYVFFRQLLVF